MAVYRNNGMSIGKQKMKQMTSETSIGIQSWRLHNQPPQGENKSKQAVATSKTNPISLFPHGPHLLYKQSGRVRNIISGERFIIT